MQILEMAKGNRNGHGQKHSFCHFPQKTEVPTLLWTPFLLSFRLSFFVSLQRSFIVFTTIFSSHTDAFNDWYNEYCTECNKWPQEPPKWYSSAMPKRYSVY